MAAFVDRTGRPGPSGWQAGAYPEGEDDHPVGGVSWYEAAAYACFAGKALPTVYHWYLAADPFSSNHVVPLSNYGSGGPAAAGQYQGVSRDGIYDMAGNVREWTANADGDARYILGGGWDDPQYSFNDAVTSLAFDRSAANGVRLVQYPDTANVMAAGAEIAKAYRAEIELGGDAEMADDAFQATFLQVHLKCDYFEPGRKVRPWLYTVATNQAIDAKRRNRRSRV